MEPTVQENTLANRQKNELKTKPVWTKSSSSKHSKACKYKPSHKLLPNNNFRLKALKSK